MAYGKPSNFVLPNGFIRMLACCGVLGMCSMAISSNLLSHDMVMTFDMFGNRMKNKIFGHFSTTNIVTKHNS
jgi:hypothetical protein